MGWQDAPLAGASSSDGKQPAWMGAPLADAPQTDGAPGFIETQLGPFAPWFGYKQRGHVDTMAEMAQHTLDILARTGASIPIGPQVERALGVDPEAAANRLKGTPYAGAGETLGGVGLGIGGEAAGIGARIGEGLTPYLSSFLGNRAGAFLANRTGGVIEQGGLNVAGALSQGQDPTQAGVIGALTGAALGPFANRGVAALKPGTVAAKAPEVPLSTLETEGAPGGVAWQKADAIPYDAKDVIGAVQNARTAIAKAAPRVGLEGQGASGVLDDLTNEALGTLGKGQSGTMSAARINDYMNKLKMQNTGDAVSDAGMIGQVRLQDLLEKKPPAPGSILGPLAPGAGAQAIADAKEAYGRFKDVERIDKWQDAAARGGSSVAEQSRQFMGTQKGLNVAPTPAAGTAANTPFRVYDALRQMGGAGPTTAAPSGFDIRHVMWPLAGGVMGGLSGRDVDWQTRAEEAAAGALLGYGVHRGIPYLANPYQAGQIANRIAEAKRAASTGTPFAYQGPAERMNIGDALRALVAAYGSGIRGPLGPSQ